MIIFIESFLNHFQVFYILITRKYTSYYSLIWKIVLVVELLGRSNGVGFKLYGFFQFFDISGILAYTFTFVVIIIIVEFIFVRPLEKKLTAWR